METKTPGSEYLKSFDPVQSLIEKLEQKDIELQHLRELIFKLDRIVRDGAVNQEVSLNIVQLFNMLLENDVILLRHHAERKRNGEGPEKRSPQFSRKGGPGPQPAQPTPASPPEVRRQSPTFSRKNQSQPVQVTKSKKSASFGSTPEGAQADAKGRKFSGYEKSITVEDMPQFNPNMRSEHLPDESILEAVRSTSMEQMVGHTYQLAKYQAGCRFLQNRLDENVPQQTALIFNEILPYIAQVMMDLYGQHLIPKLFQRGTMEQRDAMVKEIAPKLADIACNAYGVHGAQKILGFLTREQAEMLAAGIKSHSVKMILDSRGNYFIQAWLKDIDSPQSQFIYDGIALNFLAVARHKVGCIILQQCVDKGSDEQVVQLETLIEKHALELANDSFGNYVLQHAIQRSKQFAARAVVMFKGHIAQLCCQKFSSNVIESCLESNPAFAFKGIFEEITNAELETLLMDNFANFVVQKALDVASPEDHKVLVARILPYLHQLNPNLKRIQKKILQF